MLVEKKTLSGRIATLKLITGEEIIARVVEETSDHVSIKNPLAMVMMPNDEDSNQGMVAFAPWMLAVDDDAPLNLRMTSVLVIASARDDAAVQYSQAMGEDTHSAPAPKSAPVQLTGARKGGRGR